MKRRISVSVPKECVTEALQAVREGRFGSVSSYVTEALAQMSRGKSLDEVVGDRRRSGRESLDQIVADWDRELGPPSAEAEAWAKRVWERARSMRVRS